MTTPLDSADLLARLPVELGDSGIGLYVMDDAGLVRLHRGFDDGLPRRCVERALADALPTGRRFDLRPLGSDGSRLLTTYGDDSAPGLGELADAVAGLVEEWLRLELDLEAISPSSLALMEEVAMVHELTSRLPTCADVPEIAQLALEELMIAAEAERGFYVAFDRALSQGHVVVSLQSEDRIRRPALLQSAVGRVVDLQDGFLARLRARRAGAIIEVVGESPLGLPGSPESHARREAMAVAVDYGDGDEVRTVGAIVLCDKRSGARAFGSQESKMATNVAALIGGAIGHRVVAALGKELELAREIQTQILPEAVACVPGFAIAASCETSGSVGGDYFDFVPMQDGRTLALVADVSGHNLASGMVMVGTRAAVRVLSGRNASLSQFFEALLDATFDDLQRTEAFVTAAGVVLAPDHGEVDIVTAGHNDGLLCRAVDGRVERVSSGGAVLGFRCEERFDSTRVRLEQGDVLLLYTDGMVEAVDSGGEMFGDDRLIQALSSARAGSADDILGSLLDELSGFTGGTALQDDVTAVVVKCSRVGDGERGGRA